MSRYVISLVTYEILFIRISIVYAKLQHFLKMYCKATKAFEFEGT